MKRYTIDEIYAQKKNKEKQKKVARIIIYILVTPLLVYNIAIIFQLVAYSGATPSFLGYKTFVIISGSMLPELQIGDIVVVKEVPQTEINKGDIISFREGNAIVTHRICEVIEGEKLQYKTKGDSNNAEDVTPVEVENIEGKYAFKIPKLGHAIIFLQNKVGIIFIAVLMYIMYTFNKNKEERLITRKEKRELYERIIKEKGKTL